MDQKTQRYLQRIQKIMHTPKKNGSTYRPSKSPINCKTHNLDKYIKYELSTKIIQSIITRNNTQLLHQFFHSIRSSEYRSKQRIYKFIAIEKQAPSKQLYIDFTVACKLLTSAIKEILRNRYVEVITHLQGSMMQAPTEPFNKVKIDRKISERSPSSNGGLVRTKTLPGKGGFRKPTEWVEDNSVFLQQENANKQIQKIRSRLSQSIILFLRSRVKLTMAKSFDKIRMAAIIENCSQEQSQMPEQDKQNMVDLEYLKRTTILKTELILVLANLKTKTLTDSFSRIKNNVLVAEKIKSKSLLLIMTLSKILNKSQSSAYHLFLSKLQYKNAQIEKQLLLSNFEAKSRSSKANQQRSNAKSEVSHVESYNPQSKLNFYSFIDRIYKIIFILSKLLIPIKEAFVKIDQYASYSYRVEESLKVIPKFYLQVAFHQIKQASLNLPVEEQLETNDVKQKVQKFYELVYGCFKERLIEGFIYTKIISKERDIKIKIFPAKDNIVETTKRFILDREEYTSHSFESWQELKNSLFHSDSSTAVLSKLRTKSNIII